MSITHLVRLADALLALEIDPATASDSIRRMFIGDGQHVPANVSILEDSGDAIHIQESQAE